jgi:hypothetical protein
MSKSEEIHKTFRDASDRFDHFVLGALLAICAYLVQSNPYAKIGLNVETLYFISLAIFVCASIFGFRRIEQVIVLYRINHSLLYATENRDLSGRNSALELLPTIRDKAESNYRWRNRFMFLGLLAYISAKYWGVYA